MSFAAAERSSRWKSENRKKMKTSQRGVIWRSRCPRPPWRATQTRRLCPSMRRCVSYWQAF
jgi:hypothetical protein